METGTPSKVVCQCPHEQCGAYFTARVGPGDRTTVCPACGRQQGLCPVPPVPEYRRVVEEVGWADAALAELMGLDWLTVTEARKEYFMSDVPRSYAYKTYDGTRDYRSSPFVERVERLRLYLNGPGLNYNVCFLNRYDTQHNQLGWHADDSPEMDHEHPIAVVSLGAEREIWWKEKAFKGEVPPENRRRLAHGSLFVMPPGFQLTHLHRIPKADRAVGTRISLTFRRYVDRPAGG